ncbi:glycosyltransferase [Marinilabilia sp.]|uniref:glycosyltransferase n=1 Tax=Marinilabilia sp. TaxID=2021252 RepID=UPI0025BC19AF|nr:glycosyltransferase [Marinilabilia sp.]
MPLISFVVPVYNRPQEIDELLESFTHQHNKDFEIIIVEDGSTLNAQDIVEHWSQQLPVHYLWQENTGPGPARNTGAREANGEWVIFLDSDCLLPADYTNIVASALNGASFDCFGGPDKAHEDFNNTQKAIGHVMSSFLTTGGIRGGREKMDKFYPRSFNLGVRIKVFLKIRGFSQMRFGEDLDFSMRLIEARYRTTLLSDAWVWHKRRNNFHSFFKQVFNSGIARINLEARHPGTTRPVHVLPALFTIGYPLAIILSFFVPFFLFFVVVPPFAFFVDAILSMKQIKPALLAVPASLTQLMGYGMGFMNAWLKRNILKSKEFHAFENSFYD